MKLPCLYLFIFSNVMYYLALTSAIPCVEFDAPGPYPQKTLNAFFSKLRFRRYCILKRARLQSRMPEETLGTTVAVTRPKGKPSKKEISYNDDKMSELSETCSYKYVRQINGCVKLHKIPATWQDAFLQCNYEGGVLMSPLNKEMRTVMSSTIRRHKLSFGLFTGIHAKFSKGTFISIEGVSLSLIDASSDNNLWADGEPDNKDNSEECISMIQDGLLADVSCFKVRPYLCFKNSENGLCRNNNFEYNFERRTGKYYKFHRFSQTWKSAYRTCVAEGARLLVLQSDEEKNAVLELIENNPKETIRFSFTNDKIWVGVLDWNNNGMWMTIQGQSLHDAGYEVWAKGRPTASPRFGQHCGSISREVEIVDLICSRKHAFICERDANATAACV